MKDKLLEVTRAHAVSVLDVQKRIGRYTGVQVQAGSLLSAVQGISATWFDDVRPALEKASFDPSLVARGSDVFEHLLKQAKQKPRKSSLVANIGEAASLYKELIHKIEIGSFTQDSVLNIAPYTEGLSADEAEYLAEAQRCLDVNAMRGCIVLGWCAAISRVQAKVAEIGYDKFSAATASMTAKTTGRYKFYKKKYEVESLSELQRIFDTDMLWVLEFMGLIDGNQHERLRYCFEFRNNSAHPGLAPIKGANLYSFYSDISEIILKNPKFALQSSAVPE